MMCSSWDTEWDRQKFLSFWATFYSFSPLTTQKIKILKLKKTPGHIIILHICTTNDNHDVWFLRYGAQQQTEFFVILDHFCPFTPLWTQKIKILQKWTTQQKILSFYKCVPQMTVIWFMVPEIWNATDRISCHFGPLFALLPP